MVYNSSFYLIKFNPSCFLFDNYLGAGCVTDVLFGNSLLRHWSLTVISLASFHFLDESWQHSLGDVDNVTLL